MTLLFPKPSPRKRSAGGEPSADFHTELVRSTPCAACLASGWFNPHRSENHHLKEGQGLALRASPFEQIPLCGNHHTIGPKGVSYHEDPGAWPWDQRELLTLCWRLWVAMKKIPRGTPVGSSYPAPRQSVFSTALPDSHVIALFRTPSAAPCTPTAS